MGSQERFSIGSRDILFNNDSRGGSGSSGGSALGKRVAAMRRATQKWTKSILNQDDMINSQSEALDSQGIGGVEPVEGSEQGEQSASVGGDEGEASE